MKIFAEDVTRDILKKNNIRLQKRLGQNFLVHEPTVNKIIEAAQAGPEDLIIEIGPGIGSLTQQLIETGAQVISVELDQKLIPVLNKNLGNYENFQVVQGDALKVDFDKLVQESSNGQFGPDNKKYKVVANLPYYITTPIIMHLLEQRFWISDIIIMIQQEVADRLTASAGGKDCGAITVAAQYYAEIAKVTNVPPDAFVPPPAVHSTVIKLNIRDQAPVALNDEKLFFRVIKGAFAQRRKTLLNALGNAGLGFSKEEVAEVLSRSGIDSNRRGETLNMDEFALVSNNLAAMRN